MTSSLRRAALAFSTVCVLGAGCSTMAGTTEGAVPSASATVAGGPPPAPGVPGDPDAGAVETLMLIRHGEKPARGLGQLSCQGLNRALALPYVIEARYGRPDLIVAPDPAHQKHDLGIAYDYVRPLATVEPTAIYFGLPISASLGFAQVDELRAMLLAPAYRRATVLVAGEHRMMEVLARRLVVDAGGAAGSVPRWDGADYDSIYTLRIVRRAGRVEVSFDVGHEGLDGRSARCPGA